MHSHYGHMPIIRQCVEPGMHVLHQGRTYRVSAVKHDKKCLYVHTVLESLQIRDGVVEVLLNGRGLPLTH